MNCTMTLLSNLQKSLNDYSSYVWDTFYDDDVEIVTYLHMKECTIFVNLQILFKCFLFICQGKVFSFPLRFRFLSKGLFVPICLYLTKLFYVHMIERLIDWDSP